MSFNAPKPMRDLDLGGVDPDPTLHINTSSGSGSRSFRQEKPHLTFKTRPDLSFEKTPDEDQDS